MTRQEFISASKALGFYQIKLSSGVYFCSSEHMQAEQKEWDDEDLSKGTDFSSAPFWYHTNDGLVASYSSPEEFACEFEDMFDVTTTFDATSG